MKMTNQKKIEKIKKLVPPDNAYGLTQHEWTIMATRVIRNHREKINEIIDKINKL